MITLRMWGGLGNQLFIYALYEKFKSMGKEVEVFIDRNYYSTQSNSNLIYQLPMLSIYPQVRTNSAFIQNTLSSSKILYKVLRKTCQRLFFEKKHGEYDPNILEIDDKVLSGYFQTEKYFTDIEEVLREKIKFKGKDDERVAKMVKEMKSCESVSVHMRLKDYQDLKSTYGSICTKEYYKKAFEYINNQVSAPRFFLFSDDIDQAMTLFEGMRCIPVNMNKNEKSYLDMYLMSQCKYNIIANSSFSWWGAWLNSYTDKIVVAPRRWINTSDTPDICPSEWIRL